MATNQPGKTAGFTGKRRSGTSREAAADGPAAFPDRIFANASPLSQGGVSLFTPGLIPTPENLENFLSPVDLVERCVNLLADAGFEVLQASQLTINIAGPRKLYEEIFATHLVTQERMTFKPGGVEEEATYIDSTDTDVPGLITADGSRFAGLLEGIAIEEPVYPHAATAYPPTQAYWHLDVPADVALGLNAERAHRAGVTGRGITVAMVDTGWQSHPFFTDRGYRVDPVVLGPGTADPAVDENGHGTGESANIFATAPDIRLKPVKTATASGALVNVTAAFNAAAALGPDIITNSWGSSVPNPPLSAANQALAAAVAAAVAGGITVVFSAGNGGWGFPGQHPDVISVGGVDIAQNGALRASDYTSGFMSSVYPGRRVPDISGLVGMRPGAKLIMLPVPAGCALDSGLSGGTHPNGDETAPDDGWAAFSGTSAAAPQIAGVCALMKQACPRLTPIDIRSILMQTARDVTTGTNHPNFGNPATVGPDTATGNGLVDAHKAVLIAKLRCTVVPVPPVVPIPPIVPFRPPVIPVLPFRPPVIPVLPFRPVIPVLPFRPPVIPVLPFRPPVGPITGAQEGTEQYPAGAPMSADDIEEVERIIISSPEPPEL